MEATIETMFPMSGLANRFLDVLFSRIFWRKFFTIALCFLLVTMVVGCSVSQVEADIQKVITLLPSAAGIVTSILSILAAAGVRTTTAGNIIATGFQDAGTAASDILAILNTYKSNIASMPPTVLNKLDTLIAAISSQMSAIQQQFPQIPAAVAAGINVGISAFLSILTYLAAILPAPVAQFALPRSFNTLSAAGIRFGAAANVVIPSQREFSKSFNNKIGATHLKGAKKIHVNWVHAGAVPLWP